MSWAAPDLPCGLIMPSERSSTNENRHIMIIAGEASGDLHGSCLIRELRRIKPNLTIKGIGGRGLQGVGVELLADISDMAVVGLTEVLFRLGFILKIFYKLKKIFRKEKPDLLILIDYSGFNLPLAKAAKKEGIKVLYYISPQVWASRRGRIKTIRQTVDQMAVIIPFEPAIYEKEGVRATFVGHPLIDIVQRKYSRQEALKRYDLNGENPIIGILPGSRPGEVKRLLPIMLEAAMLLKQSSPSAQFILALADNLNPDVVSETVKQFPLDLKIIRNETYDVIGSSDAVMVASGTATLETALLETPMIIVYKVSELTYQIGKRFVYIDQIGLVNIIAGKPIVPEFIQGEADPRAMAGSLMTILTDQGIKEEMIAELHKIRAVLGEPGAAKRAAEIAAQILEENASRGPGTQGSRGKDVQSRTALS